MRIIAGIRKGMKLFAPRGTVTRPVLDRVKQSWFDVLAWRVEEADVLDLYAGVGSLGLEALSRGARSCVFVEISPLCVAQLEKHLARTGFAAQSRVLKTSVEAALAELLLKEESYDLIFLDPPFALAYTDAFAGVGGILEKAGRLLSQEGVLCLRRDARGRPRQNGQAQPAPAGLSVVDLRRWGRSEVLFFAKSTSGLS